MYLFVTWRLADAIPRSQLKALVDHRKAWLELHPKPWDARTEAEYHARFSQKVDAWLDAGSGTCVLRSPTAAQIVAGALHFFDGQRYLLDSYVVMPNHVHVIFSPRHEFTMAEILHSWKRHTARQINLLLRREGELWQERYWDRLLRDPLHHLMCRVYIRQNPAKAKLRDGEYILWERPMPMEDAVPPSS
ncbi:MAG: transposase [Verrucomicrobium sp.]|nr:transposase [Verrucomicrobium sp.]